MRYYAEDFIVPFPAETVKLHIANMYKVNYTLHTLLLTSTEWIIVLIATRGMNNISYFLLLYGVQADTVGRKQSTCSMIKTLGIA